VRDPGRHAKGFVDPQNDVTADDIRLAHREGFVSVEHLKRYTTLGMATDQGKFGNVVGLALMAEATGRTIPQTGTTTFRPPYTPVSIGALAGPERGRHWRPTRHTAMRAEHQALGAVFVDAGFWRRAWYYPRAGETMALAARRETTAVRSTVGMVDVSTLGKIMVQGPDGAAFLDRVYSNGFAKLPVGRARYGLMLRDDGIVMDDGTTWRLSQTDWLMTTTTANAGPVMLHLTSLLQTRWPELRVHVTSVSDHWGGVAIAGPRARAALDGACPDIDFADDAFPFMGVRQGNMRVGRGETIPVISARLSFSGELAWEVMCPADFAPAMWRTLMTRVRAEGGVPYGLEALDTLRIEKGHVTARELDGRTTAHDVGLGGMASARKPYVGRALAGRPELVPPAAGRPRARRAGRALPRRLDPLARGRADRARSRPCQLGRRQPDAGLDRPRLRRRRAGGMAGQDDRRRQPGRRPVRARARRLAALLRSGRRADAWLSAPRPSPPRWPRAAPASASRPWPPAASGRSPAGPIPSMRSRATLRPPSAATPRRPAAPRPPPTNAC
jgi:sarcosine oxidase subunit alpha